MKTAAIKRMKELNSKAKNYAVKKNVENALTSNLKPRRGKTLLFFGLSTAEIIKYKSIKKLSELNNYHRDVPVTS